MKLPFTPEWYETAPPVKMVHAKDLGYTQYHPGDGYVYFVDVARIFEFPCDVQGNCAFCHGNQFAELAKDGSNLQHYYLTKFGGRLKKVQCPMCKRGW